MNEKIDEEPLQEKLQRCQQVLGYHFADQTLLQRCLTHASIAPTRLESNERLEFFGDAILGMLISELLFHRFPDYPEGELTRIKSIVVSRNTCAAISEHLGLDECLLLGKGLSETERIPLSIRAGILEAVIAGIYLDGGLTEARALIKRLLEPEIEQATESYHARNYKSSLQQLAQKAYGHTPSYSLLQEQGPDHAKRFKMAAMIGSRRFSPAWGGSKKEAEQRAAEKALDEMESNEESDPHELDEPPEENSRSGRE